MAVALLSVEEAGRVLGVSRSTIWRWIKKGDLPSVRRGGRRLIAATSLRKRTARGHARRIPPFTRDHPMFRLAGAARGGGRPPGARDKHAILDQ